MTDTAAQAIMWLMIGFIIGHLMTIVAIVTPIGG